MRTGPPRSVEAALERLFVAEDRSRERLAEAERAAEATVRAARDAAAKRIAAARADAEREAARRGADALAEADRSMQLEDALAAGQLTEEAARARAHHAAAVARVVQWVTGEVD